MGGKEAKLISEQKRKAQVWAKGPTGSSRPSAHWFNTTPTFSAARPDSNFTEKDSSPDAQTSDFRLKCCDAGCLVTAVAVEGLLLITVAKQTGDFSLGSTRKPERSDQTG